MKYLLLSLCLLLSGCQDYTIHYVKDKRVNVCYAEVISTVYIIHKVKSISAVDCNKVGGLLENP